MELNQESLQVHLEQAAQSGGLVEIKNHSIESARLLIINVLAKSPALDIDKNITLKILDNIQKRSGTKVDLTLLSVNNNKFKLIINLAEY